MYMYVYTYIHILYIMYMYVYIIFWIESGNEVDAGHKMRSTLK